IRSEGRTVRIAATSGVANSVPVHAAPAPVVSAPAAAPAPSAAPAARVDDHDAIVSPMVGTFYRAPAPDADPYVEAGGVGGGGQRLHHRGHEAHERDRGRVPGSRGEDPDRERAAGGVRAEAVPDRARVTPHREDGTAAAKASDPGAQRPARDR